jgi:hypothetical protein
MDASGSEASILVDPDEIARRAKNAGLTATELCRRAGVPRNTFVRWKSRLTKGININAYDRLISSLLSAEREARLNPPAAFVEVAE